MYPLSNPWSSQRQQQAAATLDRIGGASCAPERLLAWNDATHHDSAGGCVVYWMARSQRGEHNLALDCALDAARELDLPLVVVFRRTAGPIGTTEAHIEWMLAGLPDAFTACATRGAHVALIEPDGPTLEALLAPDALRPALVICDDDVMPRARRGRERTATAIDVPFISVDADVVVPGACFPKQEYAARTIRPRLHRVLDQFEHELGREKGTITAPRHPRPTALQRPGITDGSTLQAAPSSASGTIAANARLSEFVRGPLHGYGEARNRPELDATSRLSHFVHFGQLSPHVVVAQVRASGAPEADIATFIEEFVVRRELAHNFVRWNPRAHELAGAADWARTTLAEHAADPREWLWDDDTLEAGDTHDPLWNAAQRQLVERGHMHGYVRMYWAKKILEWRADPADAFAIALRMNDRWQLDGRDPGGIVGVAWAIAGVHDRAWTERPIFGKIRFMSLASTGRKFDSRGYVARWGGVRGAAAKNPGWYASSTKLF